MNESFPFRRVHKVTSFIGKLVKFYQSLKRLWAGFVYAGTSGVIRRGTTVQKPLGRGSGRVFLGVSAWAALVGGWMIRRSELNIYLLSKQSSFLYLAGQETLRPTTMIW